jgi:hypothetical protein
MLVETSDAILARAEALGMPIPETYRESVIANYRRLLEQAALVMAADPPDTLGDPPEFEP